MRIAIALVLSLLGVTSAGAQYLGNYSINPTLPPAPPQLPNTFNNPYGTTSNSPQLFDSQGGYHGNVNANQYDPNSISNPYGRYGSQYSPDSINNQYGAGSRYAPDSPYNPYGHGMSIYQGH